MTLLESGQENVRDYIAVFAAEDRIPAADRIASLKGIQNYIDECIEEVESEKKGDAP